VLLQEQAEAVWNTYRTDIHQGTVRYRQRVQSAVNKRSLRAVVIVERVFCGGRESFGLKVVNRDVANAPSLEDSVRFHVFPPRILPPAALRMPRPYANIMAR
jgi:hypothetical protein